MQREKKRNILIIAAGVCLLIAAYQWGLVPALNYKQDLIRQQERASSRLQELQELKGQYEQTRQQAAQGMDLGRNSPTFQLFSYLEQQATQDGVKKRVTYMRPSTQTLPGDVLEEQVQMRLEKVRLARLIDFLKHVEFSPEGIWLKRATIRSPRTNPGQLRVDLVFAMYAL